MDHITHPWKAIYDDHSAILILGTMPSPKSRENGFYYSHPQNAFWPLLADLLHQEKPASDPEAKKEFLLRNHIAVFDVLQSCDIQGASDMSIQNAKINSFYPILQNAPIRAVFTTGKKATEYYRNYAPEQQDYPCIYLPSTSPANRGNFPYPKLKESWQIILKYLS